MRDKERPATIKIEVHRRKRELLRKFREFAKERDEDGFRSYIIAECGIRPGDPQYPHAMREFWNLVHAVENERRR